MSKPVTELYEAAEHIDLANIKTLARLDAAIDGLSKLDPTNDRVLLRVLDLVTTLPPERLGLVRWVVGLSIAQASALRLALRAAYEDAREVKDAAMAEAIAALVSGCEAALSGGEGGAKEEPKPTILPAGKPPPVLRVGMRLWEPVIRQVCKWTVEALQEKEVVVRCEHGSRCAFPLDSMRTWPLAEPFTVEGES